MPVRRPEDDARLVFVDELEVWVIRRRVKSTTINVTSPDARVEVVAPSYASMGAIEDLVRSKHDWIARNQRAVLDSPMSRAEFASREEVEQWTATVKSFVPPLVEKWEPVMGVKVGSLSYRNMKSRWGSCQPSTGRICINIRLALYPPECLEYVVVHEMCHLLESGHGPRFKALMSRFLPNWKESKKKLR